ncbi:unnamed protein product [Caretta caretta]
MGKNMGPLNKENALDWLAKISSTASISKEITVTLIRDCMNGEEFGALPSEVQLASVDELIYIYIAVDKKEQIHMLKVYFEKVREAGQGIWVVNGSSYHQQGKPCMGYAVLQATTGKVLQGRVIPHSAQAAEIMAVVVAIDPADLKSDIIMCFDSGWAIRALDWRTVWIPRDMTSADNKPVAHAKYLVHVWRLAEARTGQTSLFKIRAHRKSMAEISMLNNEVDILAKQAALMGPETLWEKSKDIMYKLQPAEVQSHLDIIQLQKQDEEVTIDKGQGKAELQGIQNF